MPSALRNRNPKDPQIPLVDRFRTHRDRRNGTRRLLVGAGPERTGRAPPIRHMHGVLGRNDLPRQVGVSLDGILDSLHVQRVREGLGLGDGVREAPRTLLAAPETCEPRHAAAGARVKEVTLVSNFRPESSVGRVVFTSAQGHSPHLSTNSETTLSKASSASFLFIACLIEKKRT